MIDQRLNAAGGLGASNGVGWSARQVLRVTAVSAGVAVVLGVVFLLMPPMGTDLSAQVARADFVRWFGARPIDFRWYGGVNQFGYSLTTPVVMAVVGVRVVGVVSAVAATTAGAYVLARTGARRPILGGALLALTMVGNLVSGRITFAAGLALAMASLALAVRSDRRQRRPYAAVVLAILTSVTSPVAGLFLGLAAGAWLLAEVRWDPAARFRVRLQGAVANPLTVGLGAGLGLIIMVAFGQGGVEPFSASSMRVNVALVLAVAVLCPASVRPLRIGAFLTVGLLLFAFYVPSAIGSNSLRLPMLFAIPVVAAYCQWRPVALMLALIGMFWWQSPVMINDLTQAGAAETKASFYQPLVSELHNLGPLGRIEVVPLRDHWESVYVADAVPLARGWLRQVDVDRNPIFYGSAPMSAEQYGDWLRTNAVSYVALTPDQPLDVFGRTEAAVVGTRPSYLREIWHNDDWRLYQVVDPGAFVTGATLRSSTPSEIRFEAFGPGDVTVKVPWSRWMTVSGGGCVRSSPDGWTVVRVPTAAEYTVSSGFTGDLCR